MGQPRSGDRVSALHRTPNAVRVSHLCTRLDHCDSEMVRHYYHLSDEESCRQMDQLDLLGDGDGRSGAGDEQLL